MIERAAIFSDDGKYRYALWRSPPGLWPSTKQELLGWVMLNPSSAAEDDDPTLRKCMGFARRAGYAGVVVVNLFAYKATDPKDLWKRRADIVGPDNDAMLHSALSGTRDVVFAWGATGGRSGMRLLDRSLEVTKIVLALRPRVATFTLGFTSEGYPRHPLYVPYGTNATPFLGLHKRAGSNRGIWTEPPVIGPARKRPAQRQMNLGDAE